MTHSPKPGPKMDTSNSSVVGGATQLFPVDVTGECFRLGLGLLCFLFGPTGSTANINQRFAFARPVLMVTDRPHQCGSLNSQFAVCLRKLLQIELSFDNGILAGILEQSGDKTGLASRTHKPLIFLEQNITLFGLATDLLDARNFHLHWASSHRSGFCGGLASMRPRSRF